MNISDIIENFILKSLGEDSTINVSRNELANFFNCAPSQINYVLNTRFTTNRGYSIDSKRGGGGFVKIVRIIPEDLNYLKDVLLNKIGNAIDYLSSCQIIDSLVMNNYIKDNVASILKIAISPKSLQNPFRLDESIRANILKNIIINIKKEN